MICTQTGRKLRVCRSLESGASILNQTHNVVRPEARLRKLPSRVGAVFHAESSNEVLLNHLPGGLKGIAA